VLILYHFAISFYAFAVQLLGRLGHKRAREFIQNRKAQSVKTFIKPHFWIHAASAGEGNQAIPIAMRLKEKMDCMVSVSFFSSSGYYFHQHTACFDQVLNFPIDQPHLARKFIEQLQPNAAIFIRKDKLSQGMTSIFEANAV